jgi:CRP-like cAMP-binding protein
MERFEDILAQLSLFDRLRLDEVGRIAKRFVTRELAAGETVALVEAGGVPRMVVVIAGRLRLTYMGNAVETTATLEAGDLAGELALVTGRVKESQLRAESSATIALLDRAGLDKILEDFPAVALPLAEELCQELAVKNDAVRQLLELHAARLPAEELKDAVADRERDMARRGARVTRLSPRALFHRLVVQQGAEPPFWMLAGFVVSLGGARLVVHLILKYHLEQQLFALVPGTDPNPMHVHHFNYGLILIGLSGLAALVPLGRRALRIFATAFGIGCGLVFDEFSLIWNLNPEYANPSSLIACGTVAGLLVQLTYFKSFWRALLRRAYLTLRSS